MMRRIFAAGSADMGAGLYSNYAMANRIPTFAASPLWGHRLNTAIYRRWAMAVAKLSLGFQANTLGAVMDYFQAEFRTARGK